jgi:predicted nucleotidyltransferase
MSAPKPEAPALPDNVVRVLNSFSAAAQSALGVNLLSMTLFGSAAEGSLRATSDVNVILVLKEFSPAQADALRDALRVAHAAIKLETMFLLEGEVPRAVEAFADKFSDIHRRRHVLYGKDFFAGVAPSRTALVARLRQSILNVTLRLRNSYVQRTLREEQAALAVANAAGPLRSCAASLIELEGRPARTPKEALARLAAELAVPGWETTLDTLSGARERKPLSQGQAAASLLGLLQLAEALQLRSEKLS